MLATEAADENVDLVVDEAGVEEATCTGLAEADADENDDLVDDAGVDDATIAGLADSSRFSFDLVDLKRKKEPENKREPSLLNT